MDDSRCFSGVNNLLRGEQDICKASTWTVIVMEEGHNNSATFQGVLATSDCVWEKKGISMTAKVLALYDHLISEFQ